MYEEQAAAFDEIVSNVAAGQPGVFFIDGPAGSGKTFLYEALLNHIRGQGEIALACAWSGIAAVLLEGGRTCHARFGLPVPMPKQDVVSSIKAQSPRAELLREAKLILWDEAPMGPDEALTCIDRLMQDLKSNDMPFGGTTLVIGGDFRQVLPVMPHASRADVVEHSIQSNPIFRTGAIHVHHLSFNMRASEDTAWRQFLLQIGDGTFPTCSEVGEFAIRVPDQLLAPEGWTCQNLADFIFPDLAAKAERSAQPECPVEVREFFCSRAILAPTNAIVDEVNKIILAKLDPKDAVTYYSIDSVDATTPQEKLLWPIDFLHSLTPSGMPPHELTVAPGALIMLMRNLDADLGLCNGVRALVVHAMPRLLDILLISGTHAGNRAYIPRLGLAPKNPDLPFVLRRRQFPVKLAWGMTCNKAQGQTLKRVGLYLPAPVFSHGQLYVSLSRASKARDVRILVRDDEKQGKYENHVNVRENGVYTNNVVWPEALLHTGEGQDRVHDVPDPSLCRQSEPTGIRTRLRTKTSVHTRHYPDGLADCADYPEISVQQHVGEPANDTIEFGHMPAHLREHDVVLHAATGSPAENILLPLASIHEDEADIDQPSEHNQSATLEGASRAGATPQAKSMTRRETAEIARRGVAAGIWPSEMRDILKQNYENADCVIRTVEQRPTGGTASSGSQQ
ncbi:MAG: AAA family ATPase [Sulfitobacter sp.]|nr:AAA family ATPase [Sulfitobacter sp.]